MCSVGFESFFGSFSDISFISGTVTEPIFAFIALGRYLNLFLSTGLFVGFFWASSRALTIILPSDFFHFAGEDLT